jgi:hypothetical protein
MVGLGNVDNTADANKEVLSATKLKTARTIQGKSFDGTADITLDVATTEAAGLMSAADKTKLDAHLVEIANLSVLGHVNHAVLTVTLDTMWSGTSAPYTKTVTVSGILATDTPIIDIVMSGTYSTDEARIEAWGYIYRAVTANGSITFYATEKPTVSLPIQIKVVR